MLGRAARDADLPPSARDLPDARDVLPNIQSAELDGRKLSEYSLNPDHPRNNGKADGWQALGYDGDTPEGRDTAKSFIRSEAVLASAVDRARGAGWRPG
jgi:hypothetical protein